MRNYEQQFSIRNTLGRAVHFWEENHLTLTLSPLLDFDFHTSFTAAAAILIHIFGCTNNTAVYVRIIVRRPFLIDHRLEINLQVDHHDLWVTPPNVAKLFRPIVVGKQQRHLVGDVQSCNTSASRSTKSNSSWSSVLVASQAAQITLYNIVPYIP